MVKVLECYDFLGEFGGDVGRYRLKYYHILLYVCVCGMLKKSVCYKTAETCMQTMCSMCPSPLSSSFSMPSA